MDYIKLQSKGEYLRSQIEKTVSMIGKVSVGQVLRMFRLYGETTVMYWIKDLVHLCKVNYDVQNNILTSRIEYQRNPSAQDKLTSSFWVIAAFGNENIEWYHIANNPVQFVWAVEGTHDMYDITYLYPGFAAQTAEGWYRTKSLFLPGNVKDEYCNHIALVFNDKDAKIAMDYGFDRYCRLDENRYPVFYPALQLPAPKENDNSIEKDSDTYASDKES